jgi:hypothetical protein
MILRLPFRPYIRWMFYSFSWCRPNPLVLRRGRKEGCRRRRTRNNSNHSNNIDNDCNNNDNVGPDKRDCGWGLLSVRRRDWRSSCDDALRTAGTVKPFYNAADVVYAKKQIGILEYKISIIINNPLNRYHAGLKSSFSLFFLWFLFVQKKYYVLLFFVCVHFSSFYILVRCICHSYNYFFVYWVFFLRCLVNKTKRIIQQLALTRFFNSWFMFFIQSF